MKAAKIIILLLILAASVGISYYLYTNNFKVEETVVEQESTTSSEESQSDEFIAVLGFESEGSAVLNESSVMNLTVETSVYETPGIEAVIRYNPALVQIDSVTVGENFDQLLAGEIDSTQGRIRLASVKEPGEENLFAGKGTFAKISYTTISTGELTFEYELGEETAPLTFVTLFNKGGDTLQLAPIKAESMGYEILESRPESERTEDRLVQ